MTVDVAELRRRVADPVSVVAALGLQEGAKRQAGGVMVRCPSHAERTPSCSVRRSSDGTIAVNCFGCGFSGDVITLVAVVRGLDVTRDFRRTLEETAALFGERIEEAPWRLPPPKPHVLPPSPRRPPPAEIADLWAACIPVYDDVSLRHELSERVIDPAIVSDRDLARALPSNVTVPSWARIGGHSWADVGNRLIVPMHDATGALVTMHARRLADGTTPKGLSPAGHSLAGAIFADPLGRLLLSAPPPAWWQERRIVISEGVPDFLTCATHFGDAEESPAVMGVIAGSWTDAIAERVPDGCTVYVRTHTDAAGEKYAAHIITTLANRCAIVRGRNEGQK